MKISKKGNKTIISDVNSKAIAALIKFNAMTTSFVFTTVNNTEYRVFIRPDLEGKCAIRVDKGEQPSPEHIKTFEETLSFIGEMMKRGTLTLEINNHEYIKKRKFYDISEKVNEKLSRKVKYFNYDFSTNVFSVVYPEKNKLPMKLHYFENNNSVLMFDEKGPHLLFGKATQKIHSVLDILTKE